MPSSVALSSSLVYHCGERLQDWYQSSCLNSDPLLPGILNHRIPNVYSAWCPDRPVTRQVSEAKPRPPLLSLIQLLCPIDWVWPCGHTHAEEIPSPYSTVYTILPAGTVICGELRLGVTCPQTDTRLGRVNPEPTF